MSLNKISGNIFDSDKQVIVNAVNCVGFMGAGIALEYRFRFPEMYKKYKTFCDDKQFNIGSLWIYRPESGHWVLNFPTKKHWKYPTKQEYLHLGLQKFCETYKAQGIKSIAFPILGAGKGGLSTADSLQIMNNYLSNLDIDIDIYSYNPDAEDNLCKHVRNLFCSQNVNELLAFSGLRESEIDKVSTMFQNEKIIQLSQLLEHKGIGQKTVEKLYGLANCKIPDQQQNLF